MFSHKMDLTLKVCTAPFTEFEFYKTDHVEILAKIKDIEEYDKYFKGTFLNSIYRIIHRTQRIHNLDEINLLFEKFYPKEKLYEKSANKGVSEYYLYMLSNLAHSFITHRNGRIALKYWEIDGEEKLLGPYKGVYKIALWNSLNRMFTTDLIVVKYLLDGCMNSEQYLNGYYSQVMLEDIQLEEVLRKGLAETHIHMGAGINFYISWQYLMTLTGKKDTHYEEDLFLDSVVDKGFHLENYVKAMAFVRVIMSYYLQNYISHGNKSFFEYVKDEFGSSDNKKIGVDEENGVLFNLLMDIYNGEAICADKYMFYSLWDKLKKIIGIHEESEAKSNILQEDILKYIFSIEKINTAIENLFLFKALKYIEVKPQDYFFGKMFWQYIRIKNEVFQLKVQGNLVKGLVNFQNYYSRSTNIDGYSNKEYWKLIMQNQFQNTHLMKLELRASPGNDDSEEKIKNRVKKIIESFFEAYIEIINENAYRKFIPAVGLVFHLIKEPDKYRHEKCWLNYKGTYSTELYFRELQDKYKKQVKVINELRESISGLAEYVVGIDAASIENNTEPWVFAPIYEEARDSRFHKALYFEESKALRVKNLGFTFHAGEDFRHLLTGIRRVDEVIEHLSFHAGDRIGHGISLGVNVDRWIENNKIVVLPRGEYLENLLWVWGLYKDKHAKGFDIGYLEQEIMRYAESIYRKMEGITVYFLWKAYRNKFNTFKVCQRFTETKKFQDKSTLFCAFVEEGETKLWNEEKLTHVQHCKFYLKKMLEPIQVEVKKQDAEIISEVQKIVVSKVSKEGIIVETNPTSNTAIGEIDSIFEHYILNLNQRGLDVDLNSQNAVMISINSDDPSVFNTNISNELAYIFYSLQEKGYSREEALMWIDKVRGYGMSSSFIEDRGLSSEERVSEIRGILDKLRS